MSTGLGLRLAGQVMVETYASKKVLEYSEKWEYGWLEHKLVKFMPHFTGLAFV